MRAGLGSPDGGSAHWTEEDLEALRLRLGDQLSALDSLERRAMTLIAPIAFLLGLGINNITRVGQDAASRVLYYMGLAGLIGAAAVGSLVVWPRRPLRDPTLTPPRHPHASPEAVIPEMLAAAQRNLRDYRDKKVALRVQLVLLVGGSCLAVAALATVR